jgi:hypothetical protein
MTHQASWCGCDPNHLPTHVRGGTGCKHANDPHEQLIEDSEQFLRTDGATMPGPAAIIQRWLNLHARP